MWSVQHVVCGLQPGSWNLQRKTYVTLQYAQVYGLPESLSMWFTQWPRAGLLQQPARVADSIPRTSYSSGSQASNTERNKEPLGLICHKPRQILQYWARTYTCISTIVSHIVHSCVQLFCFSVFQVLISMVTVGFQGIREAWGLEGVKADGWLSHE